MVAWRKTGGVVLTVLLLLGLAGGGYAIHVLLAERQALRREVATLAAREKNLRRKYLEQRSLADSMRRSRQAVESRLRAASQRLAALESRNRQLQTSFDQLRSRSAKTGDRHRRQLARLQKRLDEARNAYDRLRQESNRIIREKNGRITELRNRQGALESSLAQEQATHGQCRKHNARLAELAEELVGRYQHKGVLGSLAGEEPFTQLKKVELEKLCQTYRDRIDRDSLSP